MSPPVIVVDSLSKSFNSIPALMDISFFVPPGQSLALLGPNGAGKTTTLHILLGLTTPDSGSVKIFNRDITTHRQAMLQKVNFSSAYISLPSNLTVYENLNVFAKLYNVPSANRKIGELLNLLEISHVKNKVAGALSSGQTARLNLCKALLNDPEILYLDEPTAGLDPDIAHKVRSLLQRIQAERNTTMIYTSHNMREIEALCTRVIFLSKGKIVLDGSLNDVMERASQSSLEDVFLHIARDGELVDKTLPPPELP